jgi:asparagine synthetase B (glutamine-hydrolysing)
MAWGLEARVPFLDKAFLDVAMNVRPEDKMFSKGAAQELDEDGRPKMEKYILRKAFDVAPDGKVCREIYNVTPPVFNPLIVATIVVLAVPS